MLKGRYGIARLHVVLASAIGVWKLPVGNHVAAEWIIQPFGNLVTHGGHICHRAAENSGVDPARPDKGLHLLQIVALSRIE